MKNYIDKLKCMWFFCIKIWDKVINSSHDMGILQLKFYTVNVVDLFLSLIPSVIASSVI
jgi:hypothetical protein